MWEGKGKCVWKNIPIFKAGPHEPWTVSVHSLGSRTVIKTVSPPRYNRVLDCISCQDSRPISLGAQTQSACLLFPKAQRLIDFELAAASEIISRSPLDSGKQESPSQVRVFAGVRALYLAKLELELGQGFFPVSLGANRTGNQITDSFTHSPALQVTRSIHRRADSIIFTAAERGNVYPIGPQRAWDGAVNSLDKHK